MEVLNVAIPVDGIGWVLSHTRANTTTNSTTNIIATNVIVAVDVRAQSMEALCRPERAQIGCAWRCIRGPCNRLMQSCQLQWALVFVGSWAHERAAR